MSDQCAMEKYRRGSLETKLRGQIYRIRNDEYTFIITSCHSELLNAR